MDPNEIICSCMDVTVGQIQAAIESGAKSVKDIQDQTGAGTICGACLDDIQNLIDQYVK